MQLDETRPHLCELIGIADEHAVSQYYRRLFVIAGQFGNEAHHLQRLAANPQSFWPAAE